MTSLQTPTAISMSITLSTSRTHSNLLISMLWPVHQREMAEKTRSIWSYLRIAAGSIWVPSSSIVAFGLIDYWIFGGTPLVTNRNTWNGSTKSKTQWNICTPTSPGFDPIQPLSHNERLTVFPWALAVKMGKIPRYITQSVIAISWSTWRAVNGAETAGAKCTTSGN